MLSTLFPVVTSTVNKPESHAWIREFLVCEGEHVLGVIPRLPNEQDIDAAF